MKILIEFYDRSVLKNIVAALAVNPDKIMFFYDKTEFNYVEIYSTYLACQKHIPHLSFEIGTTDYHDYDLIDKKLGAYIEENRADELCIDLTGGSELMVIAGYQAGIRAQIPVYYTDIYKNSIVDLYSKKEKYRSMPFELTDIIEAAGGKMMGYTDPEHLNSSRQQLAELAGLILKNNESWSKTSRYFQKNSAANRHNHGLHFEAPPEIIKEGSSVPDKQLMYAFQKQRFISGLSYHKDRLSFDYKSRQTMDYMASYGVWLELYTYFTALSIPFLRDVKTSIKIDWNRHDDAEIIGNEVDVTAMFGCRPVVISCKQSPNPIGADVLNELYVVSRRLGGKYAVPVLVTYSKIKSEHHGIYLKAKEMGLKILDYDDIMSRDFAQRLKNIILK